MKTYTEKLKTREWWNFKMAYHQRRISEHPLGKDMWCDGCGNRGPFDVHHRRYMRGLDPWEYDDDDLALLCRACHDQTHATADDLYSWIISLPPECITEAEMLMRSLLTIRSRPAILSAFRQMAERLAKDEAANPDAEFLEVCL